MAVEVGGAFISVRPDLQGFHNTVKRELRSLAPQMVRIGQEWGKELQKGIKEKLNPIQVRLDVGATATQLATLNRAVDRLDGRKVTINVDAEVGAGAARLVELKTQADRLDGKRIKITVDVDVQGAVTQLAFLEQILGRLDNRRVNIQVDADTAGAIAQLLAANAAVSGLSGRRAHIGADADVGGALAGIFSVKAAMLGLAAVSAPALVGVGAGVLGLVGPLAAAGAGFAGLGAVAIPAITRIRQATQQQAQATRQAASASGQAQQQAFAQAAAQQQLAAAIRNAAQAHKQAVDQVRQAEQQLASAQLSAVSAQRALTQARLDARRSLEDLRNQVASAGLAVAEQELQIQQAKVSWQEMAAAVATANAQVAAAQTDLAKAQAAQQAVAADPAATDQARQQAAANVAAAKAAVKAAKDQKKAAELQARQAEINYKQAVQRLKEQRLQLNRLKEDEAKAAKAGVEGSDQVRSARERLAEANRRITDAERALANARANVARVDQQSADQIASARRALAQANSQAASSSAALGGQLIKLTALEQQLANAWKGLTQVFNDWAKALQPDVIPVLIKGINLLKAVLPQLTPIVKGAAAGLGELLDRANAAATSPFWTQFAAFLGQTAGPAIVGFGTLLGNLLKALAGLAQAFAPIGFAFLSVLNAVAQRFAAFATGLTSNPAFQAFVRQFVALAPMLAQTFGSLGSLIGSLFAALAPALQPALGLINTLATALAGVLRQVGPSIQAVLSTLSTGLSAVIVALAPVVTQLVQALAPLLVQLINGLKPILIAIVPVLGQVIAGLQPVIAALLAGLQPAIASLVPVVSLLVGAIAKILGALAPVLPLLGQFIASLVSGLMPVLTPLVEMLAQVGQEFATALVSALRQALPSILQIVVAFTSLLPPLIPLVPLMVRVLLAFLPLLPMLAEVSATMANALIPAFRLVVVVVTAVVGVVLKALLPVAKLLVGYLKIIGFGLKLYFTAVGLIIKAVGIAAMWLWNNAIGPAFRGIAVAAKFLWNIFKIAFGGIVLAGKIFAAVIGTLVIVPLLIQFHIVKTVVLALWNSVFVPAWNGIKGAVQKGWQFIQPLLALLRTRLAQLGAVMTWLWRNAVVPAWNGIKFAINLAWNIIRGIFTAVVNHLKVTLGPGFTWLRDKVIKPVWSTVSGVIKSAWNDHIRPTFDKLKEGINKIRDGFRTAVDAIGKIWDGLKNKTKEPVQFVINTVYSKIRSAWNTIAGLVKLPELPELHFAAGGVVPAGAYGVLPGYAPGRDTMLAAVSPGEAWIRPDATRALGPAFIHGLNSAAASGGTGAAARFVAQMGGPQFAFGGIVGKIKDAVGGAKNLVVRGASDLLSKGASFAARKILDPVLGQLNELAGDSNWVKAMTRMPRRMIDGFIGWLKKAIDPKLGGDATGVVAAAKKYLGVGDDRGRDNDNMFTRHYGWPAGTPWCALFASKAIEDAHATKKYPGAPTAAVATFNARMQHVPLSAGRPGDLATYRGSGHVNIIESKAGGGYMTIGGNQGPKVNRYVRGGQTAILRPAFARGGNVAGQARQVFGREWLHADDPADRRDPLAQMYHQLVRPTLFDSGGWLQPGLTTVLNATRRPEAVLTDGQLASVAAGSGGDGTHYHAHFDGMTRAAYESQVRAGIQAEAVLAAQRDRTGRPR